MAHRRQTQVLAPVRAGWWQAIARRAGLWDVWERKGERIESAYLITTEANEIVQPADDRMSVMLSAMSATRISIQAPAHIHYTISCDISLVPKGVENDKTEHHSDSIAASPFWRRAMTQL